MSLKDLPKDNGSALAIGAVGVLAAVSLRSVVTDKNVRRGTFNKGVPNTRGKWTELQYEKVPATRQQSRGMYNDPVVLEVEPKGMDHAVRLIPGSGSRDSITVFQVDDYLYALSYSTRMDYVGLRAYLIDPNEVRYGEGEAVEAGEMFLQGDEQIKEVLGKRGLDLSERNMAKRMAEYIY